MACEINEISGFVLAGGQSKRMGADKGMLLFEGKHLIEHPIDLLRQIGCSVSICANLPHYEKFGLPIIGDHVTGMGPLAGIHAALSQTTSDWNLFVPCDTPFLNRGLLEYLCKNANSCDIVTPIFGGRVQTVCLLCHRRCLAAVEQEIELRNYKLMFLLRACNTCFVDISPQLSFYRVDLFDNFNRPEDLNR
jgi:molybdopterin-guanine dinucleotide biosynthesis protein A